jgi:hypothetical protein
MEQSISRLLLPGFASGAPCDVAPEEGQEPREAARFGSRPLAPPRAGDGSLVARLRQKGGLQQP